VTTAEIVTLVAQGVQVASFAVLMYVNLRLLLRHQRLLALAEQQQQLNEQLRAALVQRTQLLCAFADMLQRSGKSPEDMYRWLEGQELQ
jgi:sugar diacid utilization regulator